jgi:WS/DGAT/MGAT family acyltransferase
MAGRTISSADTLWLNMDRPNNLMVIESLMLLEEAVDTERVLALLERRVLDRYPVFRQRPVPSRLPFGLPRWEDDPNFDIQRHVTRTHLAPPGDDETLQSVVGDLMSMPLPRDRPLWQVHLIGGYGDGSAVHTRLHHSMADGMALMQVLLSLTDADPEAAPDVVLALAEQPDSWVSAAADVTARLESAVRGSARLLTPGGAVHAAVDGVRLVQQSTAVAWKLLFSPKPDSPLNGRPSERKRVLWSAPIPLEPVREAGHATGTTVNDVLVAALSGAVGTYLARHHGEAVDMATLVPVDLRTPGLPLPPSLGNRFALTLLSLPAATDTPFGRLAETKRRMDRIKHSPEPVLTFDLIRLIGRTGPKLEKPLVDLFANKAVGVTANVAGPPEPRFLAGVRVVALLGWAPESGGQTLGVCIVTYGGTVRVGFKVDAWQVPAPEQLVEAFGDELAALTALVPAGRPDGHAPRRTEAT